MVRAASSSKKGGGRDRDDAESNQRKKLKNQALVNQLISDSTARSLHSLKPSKQVLKHHGTDIIRKSQRKNRFLFSFPGLLAPISGATIGDLDRLSTKNPVLYLNFPQGRLKLFGTILYPKNRYLTLQLSKGGKNVICDDYFDNIIVFSESWWIGKKEENPEETRLDFPKELAQAEQTEFDFRGGAGVASDTTLAAPETASQPTETDSPEVEMMEEDYLSEDGEFQEEDNKIPVTPVRQSQRNTGKKFNFAESSPEGSSDESDGNISDEGDEKPLLKPESSTIGHEESQAGTTTTASTSKSLLVKREKTNSKDSKLVQSTVSNLFKKAEEKSASKT